MNLSEFSDLLKQLLYEKEIVNLPGMGRLVVKNIPSRIVNEGKTITPPSVEIIFESISDESDNALLEAYRESVSCTQGEAANELAELLRQLKKTLIDTGHVELEGLGVIRFGSNGNFVFETSETFATAVCSYGLEPLSLMIKAEEILQESRETVEDMAAKTDVVKNGGNENKTTGNSAVTNESVKEKRKTNRITLAICIVLGIIILIVLLLVIFKEEFMPLLQKLLYSKEELDILQRAGELGK